MNQRFRGICARMAALALLALTTSVAWGQFLRTSYFMEGSQYRLQLNPALAPSRGFVHLPSIGHVQATFHSNSMGFDDVIDMIDNRDDADYFTGDRFYNNLVDVNNATVNAGTDLLSVGWWSGKGFWTLSAVLKVDGYATVPREWFSFMRDMKGIEPVDFSNYTRQIGNEELSINAYTEIAVGYTRQLNSWLTIGGRVKGLLGMGNMKLKVRDAVIETRIEDLPADFNWNNPDPMQLVGCRGTALFDVDADLECSFEGLELRYNNDNYLDDMKFEPKHAGVAGCGAAVDLGMAFQVTEALSLSAAVNDLGFIHWSKGCTQYAHSNTADMRFSTDKPSELPYFAHVVTSGKALNLDMLRLERDEQTVKSRRTSLASTLALGGEYKVANDKLRLGVLYTNRFAKPRNESEFTMSVNYHPSSLVDLAVSYSPVMCDGKSFGVAVKVGPLFVGSDYVFLDKNTRCCNALVGLSIPLGENKNQDD